MSERGGEAVIHEAMTIAEVLSFQPTTEDEHRLKATIMRYNAVVLRFGPDVRNLAYFYQSTLLKRLGVVLGALETSRDPDEALWQTDREETKP